MIALLGVAFAGDLVTIVVGGGLYPLDVAMSPDGLAVATALGTVWYAPARHDIDVPSRSVTFAAGSLWTCGDGGLIEIQSPTSAPTIRSDVPCDAVVPFGSGVAVTDADGVWLGREDGAGVLAVAGANLLVGAGSGVLATAARGDQTATLLEAWGASEFALGGDLDTIGDGRDGPMVAVGGHAWALGLAERVDVPRDIDLVAAADIDADGLLDVASVASGHVTLHLGAGTDVDLGDGGGPIAVGDWDDDGCDELLWLGDSGLVVLGDRACDGDGDGDGWTVDAGDCDDANADIHPTATDFCGDGIDDDCDGVDDDGFVTGLRVDAGSYEGGTFNVHPRIVGCRDAIQVASATVDALASCQPVDHHARCDAVTSGVASITLAGTDSAGAWSEVVAVEIEDRPPAIVYLDLPAGYPTVDRMFPLTAGQTLVIPFAVRDPGGEALSVTLDSGDLVFDGISGAMTFTGVMDPPIATLTATDGDGLSDAVILRFVDPDPPPPPTPDAEPAGCATAMGPSGWGVVALVGLVRSRRRRRSP